MYRRVYCRRYLSILPGQARSRVLHATDMRTVDSNIAHHYVTPRRIGNDRWYNTFGIAY